MMMKKAQSQIITTVLIILLVLAAVVIVWQVVRTTVVEGTETLTERTACIGLSLDITGFEVSDSGGFNVSVTRQAGGPSDDVDLVLLLEGINTAYTGAPISIGQLESRILFVPGQTTAPAKVQVGGKIGEVACDYLDICTDGTNC